MINRELHKTADGSFTLRIHELDENYHSGHGALQEAKHVFIENGLKTVELETIHVFEMGFGTGLNALLTAQWAEQHSCSIRYIGIELHPIPKDIWQQMDYVQEVLERERYSKIMAAEWGEYQEIEPNFQLKKVEEDILGLQLVEQVDLIYFDAFGPRAQSEMWDLPVLTKMYERLNPGGVFVTYCAQGQMKRNLKSLGFSLESLPGPPGKREMTKAVK